jgi:hypothetical protein
MYVPKIWSGIEPGPQNGIFTSQEIMRQFCKGQLVDNVVAIMARLGAFTKLRKATISFIMPVRPSAWNKSVPAARIFMKFRFLDIFRKSV